MIPGTWMWAVWLPVIVAAAVLQRRRRTDVWHALGTLALITYAFWIASAAFFPIAVGGEDEYPRTAVNLVPFRELARSFRYLSGGEIVRQHGGNFLLFVPFTLIGPAIWPRLRKWRWALAVGFGGSATIELVQLAVSALPGHNYRSTDVDDVILNTAGALFGYALFVGARSVARARRRRAVE